MFQRHFSVTEILKNSKKIQRFSTECTSNWSVFCRCSLAKQIGVMLEYNFELNSMDFEDSELESSRFIIVNELKTYISQARNSIKEKVICSHDINSLNSIFANIIKENMNNLEHTFEYVKQQVKLINQNAMKVFVAPGEGREWKSWQSDLFLEEKLFPALFPYGIGGYMSSNMLRDTDMGFANYVKNRLLSADDKFRNDPSYVFFLLLVKEMVDMKRSKQTYLRKASKFFC